MDLQSIFDLAHICHLKGIRNAVISPGSRNAALTIAFARHPKINCFSVPDERSAAFIALGMSLKTNTPTVLICTSGSAALNYAPAIAEAYFNQVPLLILSADRPPEWIGQRDGQAIFQENLFGKHVKKFFTYPSLEETSEPQISGHQMANEAINTCISSGKGPVHINIPFREPFYPESNASSYQYRDNIRITESNNQSSEPSDFNLKEVSQYSKILVVVGQSPQDVSLREALSSLSMAHEIVVVADIISNIQDVDGEISCQDLFLKGLSDNNLQPDLLITVGLSVISKNLKIFLRNHKPEAHWHIRNEHNAPDTYLSLTKHIDGDASKILKGIANELLPTKSQSDFYHSWQEVNKKTVQHIKEYKSSFFSDFNGYKKVLEALPSSIDLHLANSMAVRYANVVGLGANRKTEVFCNRGTSGIDGSNSTAVGTSLMSDVPTFLITGDMAFLYDRNAFWHNHLPPSLKIIIFNNHGGGIFRMIDGPSQQPELEEFFETRQQNDAQSIANEFGFKYFSCSTNEELEQWIPAFMTAKGREILEIFTDAEKSKLAYKELFNKLPN